MTLEITISATRVIFSSRTPRIAFCPCNMIDMYSTNPRKNPTPIADVGMQSLHFARRLLCGGLKFGAGDDPNHRLDGSDRVLLSSGGAVELQVRQHLLAEPRTAGVEDD